MIREVSIIAVGLVAIACAPGALGQQLFWLEQGTPDSIVRLDVQTGSRTTVVQHEGVTTFSIDLQAEQIYFGVGTATQSPLIMRCDLDGSNIVEVAPSGATTSDIRVDHLHGKLYWTDSAIGKIHRAGLDGSDVELLSTVGLHVNGLALDPEGGRMFYTVTSTDNVWSADLLAQDATPIVTTSGGTSQGIALDKGNGLLYFGVGGLQRSGLDGDNVELVVSDGASGIALDLNAQRIYWANSSAGAIRSAPVGGGPITDVLTGLDHPKHIALIQAPPCPADLNHDGAVDTADLGALIGAFGSAEAPDQDINGDGVIDTADLGLLIAGFGPCPD